ncbi:DNA polymerase/3'-5' exonuclease PolX [candidate division WWE3 bacterium]|uniref:DNA-directed DNA polymerase n=1 Tax=candidate division WWE3 bacterium TaxID=2053526 RepID=A0A7X9E7C8_UNCKA|nr:DNA polymerase/3'-5' exonuclease PolX [candidate division WWE3 bacterium]
MEGKRLSNKEVVTTLKEILAAMEVKGVNPFRIRAYQNAVSILDNLTVSIYDLWQNKRIREIPGVGEGIESHLNELFSTGKVQEFENIKEDLPEGMFSLIGLRGVGAKRAFKLAVSFKLNDRKTALDKLKDNAQKGNVRTLEGFGEKIEKAILEAIEEQKMTKNSKVRFLLPQAEQIVNRITSYMKKCKYVDEIEAAGSFRRRNPTIGDLDIPVSTTNSKETIKYFLKFPEIGEVLVTGDKKASVVLKNDVQVDLRVSTPQAYGSMLQYFTGSKQHNIILRNYALNKGMSLSEYGIKKGGITKEFSNEKDFYNEIGLPYIPPEIRHGNYEIEAADKNKLPKLINLKDIKGDMHMHTILSDGVNTIEEMVEAAAMLGYEYIGISDHAPSIQSRGLGTVLKIVNDTRRKINEINELQDKVKVLYGYEVNILVDNTLGLPDDILNNLDYVIAGVHASFNQDKKTVTERILTAMENPYVNIISHPSGRMLNERDPIDPDWNKIFDTARDKNIILEINGQPSRLDLPDDLIKSAIEWGVKLIIGSDAHSTDELLFMKYGIENARRGWASKDNILNTLSYERFVKELKSR